MKDESVVFEQGQRIGGQVVQRGIVKAQGRLRVARRLLLAQDVGNVVGAEGTGCRSFRDSVSDRFGSVLPDQFQ